MFGYVFIFVFAVLLDNLPVNCVISRNVKDECQKTKGCVSKPPNCTPFVDCAYFMSYAQKQGAPDTMVIELLTMLSEQRSSRQWVAVGFSNDNSMGDDSVTYCIYSADNPQPNVGLAFNNGKTNQIFSGVNNVVTPIEGGIIDNSYLCRLEQKVIPGGSDPRIRNLDKSYNLLLASGLVNSDNSLQYHTQNKLDLKWPLITDKITITDTQIYSVTQSSVTDPGKYCVTAQIMSNLVKAHGILMIFGWWVFVATAIIFARYFRSSWPGKKILGTLIWFNCHRGLNTIGVLMIASAFICIFIAACGVWVGGNRDFYRLPEHAITGMTAAICAFVQPIVAALRCHPGTAKRPIFNWIHRFIGLAGFCCACATIWFATYFEFAGLHYSSWSDAPRAMMIFYWVTLVVVVIALELLITISERIQRKKITNEMHMQGLKGEPSLEGTGFISKPLWNILRLALLGLFVIVALAVAITLSCFIGIGA